MYLTFEIVVIIDNWFEYIKQIIRQNAEKKNINKTIELKSFLSSISVLQSKNSLPKALLIESEKIVDKIKTIDSAK